MAFGNGLVPMNGGNNTPAVPWTPPASLGGIYQAPITQLAKAPEPQLAGIARPFPVIGCNEKENDRLVLALAATDAEDAELYLNPAPNFTAASILVAPVAAVLRHSAIRDNKTSAEFPNSQGPCPWCATSDVDSKSPNRCENSVDIVLAAVGTMQTGPQRVFGLYTVNPRKTAFDEGYAFWHFAIREALAQGVAPFAKTYQLGFQNINSKATGFSWNIYRFFRQADSPETQRYYRERRNSDGTMERPSYRVMDTPQVIVSELTQRLVDGTIETYGISMLGQTTLDASKAIREQIKRRTAGQPFAPMPVAVQGFGQAAPQFVPPQQPQQAPQTFTPPQGFAPQVMAPPTPAPAPVATVAAPPPGFNLGSPVAAPPQSTEAQRPPWEAPAPADAPPAVHPAAQAPPTPAPATVAAPPADAVQQSLEGFMTSVS